MNKVYILLGSNLGDRTANLKTACDKISSTCGNIILRSSLYETSPWGMPEQATFLNGVLLLETILSPEKLLEQLLRIEQQMGRVRIQKWGERLIDLDILYFNDIVLTSENLTIPHPELQNRNFTLVPLCEIAPEYLHPKLHKNTRQLLDESPDNGAVTKLSISL